MTTAIRIVVIASACIGLAVGVAWCGRSAEDRESSQMLTKAVARATALGVPVYAEDIRKVSIPDNENAWIELNQISDRLRSSEKSRLDTSTGLTELLSMTDDIEFLKSAPPTMNEWESFLELSEQAAKKSKYKSEHEWERGLAMLQRDVGSHKDLIRAFLVQSRSRLLDGNQPLAISSLDTAIKINRFLDDEQTMLGYLVCNASDALIAREIINQARDTNSAAYRSSLKQLVSGLFPAIDIKYVMNGETLLFIEWVRHVNEESQIGNKLRIEINSGYSSDLARAKGFSLPADKAREFEALAIEAVCDFYEKLSPSVVDYRKNDAILKKLFESEIEWLLSGYSYGWYEIGHMLGMGEYTVFRDCAQRAVGAEAYLWAFEISCGLSSPKRGEKRMSKIIMGAYLIYDSIKSEFSVSIFVDTGESSRIKFEIE